MHEQLIAELTKFTPLHDEYLLMTQAAAALRDDAKTIAELRAETQKPHFANYGELRKVTDECERLRAKLEKAEEANARLRKVIEEAIKHQEIVGGSLSKMSTTVRILRNALEGE